MKKLITKKSVTAGEIFSLVFIQSIVAIKTMKTIKRVLLKTGNASHYASNTKLQTCYSYCQCLSSEQAFVQLLLTNL